MRRPGSTRGGTGERTPGTSLAAAVIAAATVAWALSPAPAWAAGRWGAVVSPDNSLSFTFVRGEEPVFRVGLGGWGPSWARVGVASKEKAAGDRLSVSVPFAVNQ